MTKSKAGLSFRGFIDWAFYSKPVRIYASSKLAYNTGTLVKVKRDVIARQINTQEQLTFVWIPSNKARGILYILVDFLGEIKSQDLTCWFQILSSYRTAEGRDVPVTMHLSEAYGIKDKAMVNKIAYHLVEFCSRQIYSDVDWNWEIETSRKQLLKGNYTYQEQLEARVTYYRALRRFSYYPATINKRVVFALIALSEPPQPESIGVSLARVTFWALGLTLVILLLLHLTLS